MAGSKKKKITQKENPRNKYVGQVENGNAYYQKYPSWNFNTCDKEYWTFSKETVGDEFWSKVLPRLQNLETETWRQILVYEKKQNHSIDKDSLHINAWKRIEEQPFDPIISLRIDGTHRLYGYIEDAVFNVLWYDNDHGDNDTCVCRSKKKHT